MVFGFGPDINVKSVNKFNVGINQDEQSWYSEFNYGCNSGGGCFGGGYGNSWASALGIFAGAAAGIGLSALFKGKGGGGGIFSDPRCFFGAGGGAGGSGGFNPYSSGFGIDNTGYGGFNPNPIRLHDIQFGEGSSTTGSTSTTGTGNGNGNGNGSSVDGNGNGNNNGNSVDGNGNGNNNGNGNAVSNNGNGNGNGNGNAVSGTGNGNGNGSGNGAGKKPPVSSGNGVPTGAYLKTLIEGDAAGKAVTKGQGVESLKKGDSQRKAWADNVNGTPATKDTTDKDYKDAVKLGKANGDGEKEMDGDYPKYFTITDNRSHNMYTFQYVGLKENGTLKYKFVASESDLLKDDGKNYNNVDWKDALGKDGADGKEFTVRIENGEIILENDKVYVARRG